MAEILEESDQLVVRIAGQEMARYHYGPRVAKPYLYPLRAANGLSLLADTPLDHRHHHGFWVGHGRVVGTGQDGQPFDADCWLERHNSGAIRHERFENIASGASATFADFCRWEAPSGETILRDRRVFTFYDDPPEARRFDFEIELSAPSETPVALEPTNEAGLPHVRVADGLTVRTGGTLTNASAKRNERGTYRQRSPWLDASGKLGRLACGVAVFDHPDNPAFPTPWFTRDYGPFAPNYGFFQPDPIVIAPGKPLRLRYRVFVHSGDVVEGGVAEAWDDYESEIGGLRFAVRS